MVSLPPNGSENLAAGMAEYGVAEQRRLVRRLSRGVKSEARKLKGAPGDPAAARTRAAAGSSSSGARGGKRTAGRLQRDPGRVWRKS